MNDRQREMIAHALGLPEHPWRSGSKARRWACRNYYCAGADDEPQWRDLAERGFAMMRGSRFNSGPIFIVTSKGAEAAGLLDRVPRSLRFSEPERRDAASRRHEEIAA